MLQCFSIFWFWFLFEMITMHVSKASLNLLFNQFSRLSLPGSWNHTDAIFLLHSRWSSVTWICAEHHEKQFVIRAQHERWWLCLEMYWRILKDLTRLLRDFPEWHTNIFSCPVTLGDEESSAAGASLPSLTALSAYGCLCVTVCHKNRQG